MDSCDLTKRHCTPCEGGIKPFSESQAQEALTEVPGWKLHHGKISREFEFKDFKGALKFLNGVGAIAEAEGHHPDLFLHNYKFLRIVLWTHAISGLSQNDFILAAKINAI